MEKDKEIDENKNLSPKQRKLIFVYFAWFFMCILMALPFFTRSCISKNELNEEAAVEIVNASEISPEFAGFRFPLLDKKIY